MTAAGAGLAAVQSVSASNSTSRAKGAQYMGYFSAPKLDKIRIAVIGCGARGGTHYHHLSAIENTEIVALCDLYPEKAERAKQRVLANDAERHKNVKIYTGADQFAYRKMLKEQKPDLVYVVTPWNVHAPMAIDSMNAGAHVCVEVPLCVTIKEAWDIVDTSERTQKHCMMLENVNYGRDELLYLNMCRKGVFGELLHGEASYIHELRGQMHSKNSTGSWRTYEYANRNGNLYPTHGLGPVAQYMDLGRTGDNFGRITSFSTPARGRALYAKEKFPADHKWNKLEFEGGDLSTSIIKTVNGKTIMVQWDETSPRPYSRHNLIQGTKGTGAGFPTRIALDYKKGGLSEKVFEALCSKKGADHTNYHGWTQGQKLAAVYEEWDHPLYKRMKADAAKMGGHGGMDFIMNYRVVECLRNGTPLDQNVYEGAFWSAVGPLSEASVAQDGTSVAFPDFTRGNWKNTPPLPIIE